MKTNIDLHIHTNLSDGELSPKEVIDEAIKNGVSVIAIADHDTCDAYDKELYDYAQNKNVKIIKAVEISTTFNKIGIHVLGYNFDINNKELRQKLLRLKNARHDYLYGVAAKLEQLGYILNTRELDKIAIVTKAHIANDIINNPKNRDILLQVFKHIPNKGEFIEGIMNEGKPAYVKKETITPIEAAKLIKMAGGKVVLAHPVAYKYEDNLSVNEIVNLAKNMEVDGIEANYIYIDRHNNKINEIAIWNEVAKENNFITTVGSDFHNKDNIHPVIGLINENLSLNDTEINNIINRLIG